MSETSTGEEQPPIDTVVLDVDGTLVDSVYQHVAAWQGAFHDVGLQVSAADVHRAIGLGSDRMVSHLAGDSAERAVGDDVRQAHDARFMSLLPHVRELPGVTPLLEWLAQHHALVVATSGGAEMTEALLALVEARGLLRDVVSGSEVEQSKPAPDLIDAAMQRVESVRAVVLGDSVWDAQPAKARGLPCIALRCGGTDEAVLREAGASWVYADPQDLYDRRADSPLQV
ncbi:HAD family hydrolase [Nocardioides sp. JQ2195]|uniref:HAD family hydrolase n=1 Tax=Nocardioides sp. JQ2195 TaxID=2592334 RepID=UPI00143E45BB|nr:HAD family hydrolase [Nocardioides sp. JQ2195]QIX27570.1 HAD family hydrolase [Nocardioides sp. JQ2195]